MKKLLIIAALLPLPYVGHGQIFSGESLRGTALGGLLGGIIGHNSGRKTAEGIGIGAGTGWLLSTLAHEGRERGSYDTYIPSRRRSVYADSAPVYRTSNRPNYAITGTAVGALAGGIIGHNQGRHTMEGAGIGAATGLVLGGIAEQISRDRENRHYFAEEAAPRPTVKYFRNPTVTVEPAVAATPVRRTGHRASSVFQRVESSRTSRSANVVTPTVVINNYYVSRPPLIVTNSISSKN